MGFLTPQLVVVVVAGLVMIPGVAVLWDVNLKRDAPLPGPASLAEIVNAGWDLGTREWNIRAAQFEVACIMLIWVCALLAVVLHTKRIALLLQSFIAGLIFLMFVASDNCNWSKANMFRIFRNRLYPDFDEPFPSELKQALAGVVLCYMGAILSLVAAALVSPSAENRGKRLPFFLVVAVLITAGSIVLWTSETANYGSLFVNASVADDVNTDTLAAVIIALVLAAATFGGSPAFAVSALTLVGASGFFFLTDMYATLKRADSAEISGLDQTKAGYVLDWVGLIITLASATFTLHLPANTQVA